MVKPQFKSVTWWWQQRIVILALLLTGLFVLSRLYAIQTSLLYFIDAGRDSNVLLTWQETGKPPLLGPQTSVLPFNQSAWYFYLLMPAFLLMHGSPFAAIYTGVVLYVATFGWLLWVYRQQPRWQTAVLVLWLLILSHPQFIIQNRFIWNPSFVTPAVLVAVASLERLQHSRQWYWFAGVGLGLAAAVGFSYSAAPVLIASIGLGSWGLKRDWWKLWLAVVIGLLVVMGPTLAFEVRHHFPLTQMLLTQPPMPQTEVARQSKQTAISRYSLEPLGPVPTWSLFVVLTGVLIVAAHQRWWRADQPLERMTYMRLLGLWAVTILIVMMMPVSILSHYIFGFVTLWLVSVALLPRKFQVLVVALLLCFWWWPTRLQSYVQPARRTVSQMQACFQQVCHDWANKPMYVSVQAGFHPFHAAQEHRYLLRQAGCTVPEIDVSPQAAQYMAVVVDESEYQHNQTAYNELTQFGPSTVVQTYPCQANFQVVMLQR